MFDFSASVPGTLPTGTVTEFGPIRETSLTAYLVDGPKGPEWVAFRRIHGRPTPITPLITFG